MTSLAKVLYLPAFAASKALSGARPASALPSSTARKRPDPEHIGCGEERSKEGLSHTRGDGIRILSIADDDVLLNTRQMVLESAGFLVRSISSLGKIEEAEVRGIGLALICHSVEEDRVSAAVHSLRKIDPAVSIVQLCIEYVGRKGDIEQIAPCQPRELLTVIRRILETSASVGV